MRAALVVSLVALARIALAQDESTFEGRRIARIQFDPRFQPLPEDQLARLLPFQVGSALRASDIHDAIQKLYSTGRYSDIQVDGELQPPDGVVLTIRTERTYFVSEVAFEGVAEPPTKGQLFTATKLELGKEFNESQLPQAEQNIQERLRANGLYDATVTHTVERFPDTEEVVVRFKIAPGERARFDGVTLTGDFNKPANIIDQTRWRRGLGFIKLPGWREATESRVSTGVNRVLENLQHGDHLEATVTLEDLKYDAESNTVTPSLLIDSGPILQVRTTGAKVSPGKLRQLIPVYQERTVDRSLLVEGRRNLIEYFQSLGYFDAGVEFHETPLEGGRETIDYSITLNERHSLTHVGIDGNRYFEEETLRQRLEMSPARRFGFHFGRYSQRILDHDMDSIRDLYRSNGFRDADVSARIADDYGGVHGHLSVILQVKEGPQWFVNRLTIEGAPESDLPYLHTVLQSTAGEPFSEANVAADRDSILSYYFNNGYPDASFDWSQAPGPSDYRVDVTYTISPGKREYVRSVIVRGLKTTRESVVEKRISLSPGDPISQNEVAQSQQKLYDLGIFSKVQTAVQNPDGDEESKYLLFDVDEADRYSFTFGVGAQLGRIGGGVTTFDEPAGTTGFVPRISFGVSRLNLFGEGRTLSLQTRFSTIEQRVLLSYIAPQLGGNPNLTLTVSGLFDDSRDIRTFAARRREVSAQLAQKLTRANSVQYRLTFRRVDISNVVISPELIPLLSQPEQVGMFSMTFIQDRRDDPINSHRGIYNTIDVGIALRQLASETEFTRVLMRNSTYHPIGKDIVLARTLQFGWIQRIAGLPEIPLAERFFAGGASSDRAFPDNQAGPRDLDTGFPLGGDALLMHSTELRFPLIGDTLGGVLFHDMGNVYDNVQDISFRFRQENIQDFDYMVQAVGIGLRYKTPIGPIRVDFSFSPDAPRFFGFQGTFDQLLAGTGKQVNQKINLFQFHFSLGQTF